MCAAFGAATPAEPKFVSHADPASQWTAAQKGPAVFTYSDNYLIDTDNAVILDVEATRSIRQAEVGASRTMIDRVERRFGLNPTWLTADTAYGSGDNLDWVVRTKKIVPFIPVFDKSDAHRRHLVAVGLHLGAGQRPLRLPRGPRASPDPAQLLRPEQGKAQGGSERYRAQKSDCQACPSKPRCCPNADARYVTREEHEDVRDLARECTASEVYRKVAGPRRKKVEMLFAHLKRILGLGRLRLRGPCGAKDEFTLAAIAQNLRKLAKLRPQMTGSEAADDLRTPRRPRSTASPDRDPIRPPRPDLAGPERRRSQATFSTKYLHWVIHAGVGIAVAANGGFGQARCGIESVGERRLR